jgi:signal transduction histidine kinase
MGGFGWVVKSSLEFCLFGDSIAHLKTVNSHGMGDLVIEAQPAEGGAQEAEALRTALAAARHELADTKEQVEIERLISTLSTSFINASTSEIDAGMSAALQAIGERAGADRSYVVLFSDDGAMMQYTYEWCAAGVASLVDRLRRTPSTTYPWWTAALIQGQVLSVDHLSEMPPSAKAERAFLEAMDIRSFLNVPVLASGAPMACLGVSSLGRERHWEAQIITLLERAGDVLAQALLRKRAQQHLGTQYTVARVLAESTTFGESIPKLLQSVCQGVGTQLGEFWRVDRAAGVLYWGGAWHVPTLDAAEFCAVSLDTTFPPGTGLAGRVWATGAPEWLPDVRSGNFVRTAAAEQLGLHGAFAFPIRSGSQVTGVMTFFSQNVLQRDTDLLQMLDAIGGQIGNFTERMRVEEEVRRLNVELEQRVTQRTAELAATNRELEAFSYSVSHDLRAPLRAIEGFGQTLWDEHAHRLDEDGRDYLRRLRAASRRMVQLIDDLLHLSRVTRGHMRRELVDLSSLAAAIAAELQKAQPERRVAFVIADALTVRGDARLLRIALENLFGNAWKYTAKHEQARIEFGATTRGGQTIYFVGDDGAGFNMAFADKLFGPFQRLHRTTDFEGTGIGLTTVQRIVHRHGGVIWAQGAVEQGATFYLTLDSGNRE